MRISSIEEYGLRVALHLARARGSVSAAEVAKMEGLSAEYAGKILHLFKKAKLVVAQRGVRGGFQLAIDPSHLSVATLFAALQEGKSMPTDFCQLHRGNAERCVHIGSCSIQPLWRVLFEGFDQMLGDVMLGDLLLGEVELKKKLKTVATSRIDQMFESIA